MATRNQPVSSALAPADSRHKEPAKLESQAATAALYATGHGRQRSKSGQEFLDKNRKLSSAGAAASLKYANPEDLPSYPSAGLKNDSAAGAAANLGWANQKSFEHWKPDPSASASTAAMLAKDYKSAPAWQPEQSANGAKAAIFAHRDNGKVESVHAATSSPWGHSAATQAFKRHGAGSLSPKVDSGFTSLGRQGSLIAANGAMSQGRKRANTTPTKVPTIETYPDEARAASNALSAANSAHKGKSHRDVSPAGGSSPYTNMSRNMFTSHPPVKLEVDEKKRQDTLHASAVAMAQGMFKQQQKQLDASTNLLSQRGAAAAARGRSSSISTIGDEPQPMGFNNLQEAAHKLAQERLSKLHDEHSKNREYRDYYGNSSQPKSRLSIRGRTRRRASSDGQLDEDKEQSNKIRAQMSMFSSNLNQVDEKKRKQDREALIAAAQRNVTKRLHGMDEKVFAETGQVGPSLLSDWEVKAHATAQAKSDSRMENYGKIDIGGGKFVDQEAVTLIAQRNVQPVLDEINAKAEAEREKQAALKVEQDAQAAKSAEKKARDRETKETNKKLKQQDRDEEKSRKADGKAAKKEEERAAKERRKSLKADQKSAVEPATEKPNELAEIDSVTDTSTVLPAISPIEGTLAERREISKTPAPIRTSMEDQASIRMKEIADAANGSETTPMSPGKSPKSGQVKSWLKSKFVKRQSKSEKTSPTKENAPEEGFVGGASYTGATKNDSTHSFGPNSSSMRDVALAGKANDAITQPPEVGTSTTTGKRISNISSISSFGSGSDDFQEARDQFGPDLAPPQPQFTAKKSQSPARDSKFKEVID